MIETALKAKNGKRRVVILGGGFGGAYCAQRLEKLLPADCEVLLIDPHNYFVFTPLLVEAGTGSLQPRHAVVPIRSFLRKTRFLAAMAEEVDLQLKTVKAKATADDVEWSIEYDHLVLALGSVTNLPPVPGLKEFAFEMKNLRQAIALRDRAIQMLELASATSDADQRKEMLHFVVVGANFTGVEVAGEFQDYLKNATRHYPGLNADEIHVTIVDRNEKVLSVMDEPTLSEWAADHMQRRGIELRLRESVNEIRQTWIVLRGGDVLRTRTVIWCAGIAPNPVLGAMRHNGEPLPSDHGWIMCERDGRVKGQDALWGVGDCAVNPDMGGKGYPATAQAAIGEARGVADNIARVLRREPTLPIEVKDRGALAAFGRFDAVAKVMGLKFTGFIAWWLWRTVYLMKMPGLGRKIRVAADWTLDFVTHRDYVELGLGRPAPAKPAVKEPAGAAA